VVHSIVMQYLPRPDRGLAELRLTTWPSGRENRLGAAGYHGRPVRLALLSA
jgi:hypothetical protein